MIFDPNYKEVEISNKGDVISLSKVRGFLKLKERIITPTIKANKYLDIKLVKDGISKHFHVENYSGTNFTDDLICL